jgi:hypothetical protein
MQRQFNWQNAQRVDVPHLRLVESAVTADFQLLAGQILAGGKPVVVRGFTIPVAGVIGNPAANLSLLTAAGMLLHPTAAESGSVFSVPSSQAPEVLNASNAKVKGSFVPGTNYVGIDLVRSSDAASADSVRILSDATHLEFPQTLPLGRTLGYRIYIQTTDFDHALNVLPVALVVVDANGNVTSVTDARQMAFRLGQGGTAPAGRTPWTSLANRAEPGIVADAGHVIDPFSGGDKSIGSFREWMSAVMTRLWEVGGGVYWYSPSAERDLKLNLNPATKFAQTGENWFWDGTNLLWQGIRYLFANGVAAAWNKVADQTVALPGKTDLLDGDCLYIDLDRTQNAVALVVTKAQYASLPAPTIPGSRRVIAWREFGSVYVDGERIPVNTGGLHASTTVFGIAKLWALLTGDTQTDSIVTAVDSTGRAIASGMTNPGAALAALNIGGGAYDNAVNLGGGVNAAPTNVLGALGVTGIATMNGALNVTGITTLNAALNVTGIAKVFDTLDATGARVLKIGPAVTTKVQLGAAGIPTDALGLLSLGGGVDTTAAAVLNVGVTTATGVTVGKAGVALTAPGGLKSPSLDVAAAAILALGGATATEVDLAKAGVLTKTLGTFTAIGLITATAGMDSNNQKIVNLLNPTLAQDAATKTYVDAHVGLFISAGRVNHAAGVATLQKSTGSVVPTIARLGAGSVRVTVAGLTVDGIVLVAFSSGGTGAGSPGFIKVTVNAGTFDVLTENESGAATDFNFSFQVAML